jgi:Brp/Blh family beta-carotene 15,15'-monooxygenase
MQKLIKKINFFHSLSFMFLASLFALITDQFRNLTISPTICLLLILSIGISHGALDNLKGKRLLQLYKIESAYIFYLIYLLIGVSIIALWSILPTFSLIIFLIVASYHFGKEDTEFLNIKKTNLNLFLYFFKGLLIIIAPLIFHFVDTIAIFKLLLIENENFYSFLLFIENKNILLFIFSITLFVNIYFFLSNFEFINFLIFFDFLSIVILNYFLSPLISFTIYFCFLH